jgi:hypothetical protein
MSVRRPQSDVIAKLKRNMVLGKYAPPPAPRLHEAECIWYTVSPYSFDETPTEKAIRLKRNATRVKRRHKK